jgi:hypothetical protein
MAKRSAGCVTAIAMTTVFASTVHAQRARDAGVPPTADAAPAISDSPRDRARVPFYEGIALVQSQQWSEALDRFNTAYSIFPSKILEFNIGYCQRALGQYTRALQQFRVFLTGELEGAALSRREEAQGYVTELESRVARLTLRLPVELRSANGPELVLDGHPVAAAGRETIEQVVDPGPHTIQARVDGSRPFLLDRTLRPGESAQINVVLEALPAHLLVASNVSGARVLLDGEPAGTTPLEASPPPGRHRVEVIAPGRITFRATLSLTAGATSRVSAELPLEPVALTRRWWFWTAIGVAVTGAAAGTYFAVRPPAPYERGSLNWVVGEQTGSRP